MALTAVVAVGTVPAPVHQRLVYSDFGKIKVYDTVTGHSTVIFRRAAPQTEGGGEPSWSPDGKQILLAGNRSELLLIRLDGPVPRRLLPGTLHPAGWSSDGRWIAYQTFLRDGGSDLRIIRSDGTGMHRISTASSVHPVWVPRTHRMVVGRALDVTVGGTRGFRHDIVVVGAGAKLVVVPHSLDADDPAVSRNGRWIAFAKNDSVYVEHFDGTGFHAVTTAAKKQSDTQPAWSPDGKRLTFTRTYFANQGGFDYTSGIMVVGVNGSGTRPLGDQDTMNSDSSWSPDGNFISFQHGTDCCGDQLVIADVHTGRERTIGYFDGNDSRPDWAPLAS